MRPDIGSTRCLSANTRNIKPGYLRARLPNLCLKKAHGWSLVSVELSERHVTGSQTAMVEECREDVEFNAT